MVKVGRVARAPKTLMCVDDSDDRYTWCIYGCGLIRRRFRTSSLLLLRPRYPEVFAGRVVSRHRNNRNSGLTWVGYDTLHIVAGRCCEKGEDHGKGNIVLLPVDPEDYRFTIGNLIMVTVTRGTAGPNYELEKITK